MNTGADGVTLTVEFNIPTGGAVLLDGMSGCAFGLVADKHDVVPHITQHGLEVVDHPAGVAHAAAGNHHGRLAGADQPVKHPLVLGMRLHLEQLIKAERSPAGGKTCLPFCVPALAQLAVQGGETPGQRRIQNDGDLLPLGVVMHDAFEFIEQLLGTANAEGRHDHGTAIGQRLFQHLLQAGTPGGAIFVQAVAVGAFQYQQIGALGWLGRFEQGCAGGTKIAGEDDTLAALFRRIVDIDFKIGRPENMPGRLEAHPTD